MSAPHLMSMYLHLSSRAQSTYTTNKLDKTSNNV